MNPDLITKYDRAVPRYTSYPTAPHFSQNVDAATYRRWLAEVPEADEARGGISLYVHIPYCDTMCWFCGCHTKIVNRYDPIGTYLDHLIAETDLVADAMGKKCAAKHIHWGGGTPTSLEPDDIVRLALKLQERFEFADDYEFAVEIDPRKVRRQTVEALGKSGVTRASLGIQDFNIKVQEAINRIQPFDETKQVVDWLREEGISRINFDLMYGLPYQTKEDVLRTAQLALSMDPDRLSLFGYAHVPWMKSHQKMIDEAALPDATERWEQFLAATDFLEANGFIHIGLDHFARADDDMAKARASGNLKRNFQGYTTDTSQVLIGLGASAIGRLPQGYVQNNPEINLYRRAIAEGALPTSKGIALSADDKLRREIIETLMCNLVVDVAEIAERYGQGVENFADAFAALKEMAADGFVTIDANTITVREDGWPLVRTAAATFDAYLGTGAGRHSRAV